MAMIWKTSSRQQSTATFFPARRSSRRRAGLAGVLLRCAGRHSFVVSFDAPVIFGKEAQALIPTIENPEALELLGSLRQNIAPITASMTAGARFLAPFQIATVEDEDEGDDLDEEDDLIDDDDEDLDEDDEDEEADEDEDEEDDLDDLDDDDDEEEDDDDEEDE